MMGIPDIMLSVISSNVMRRNEMSIDRQHFFGCALGVKLTCCVLEVANGEATMSEP